MAPGREELFKQSPLFDVEIRKVIYNTMFADYKRLLKGYGPFIGFCSLLNNVLRKMGYSQEIINITDLDFLPELWVFRPEDCKRSIWPWGFWFPLDREYTNHRVGILRNILSNLGEDILGEEGRADME